MVPTSLSEQHLDDAGAVRAYKSLARVERAFWSATAPVDGQECVCREWSTKYLDNGSA